MQAPEATLIAAIVAASATLLNLFLTLASKRGEEYRAAHRDLVADDLKGIGKAIHEVVALSTIQFKLIDSPQYPGKYKLASEAAARLKQKRMDVRYSLWGLDEAIRTLARLPDWIGHAKLKPDFAAQIVSRGQRLSEEIDRAVRSAYVDGKSPGWWRTWRVNGAARRLRTAYERCVAAPRPVIVASAPAR